MTGPILIVGAGPSGLGCATALAAAAPVVIVDRIPVAGGTIGWDDPAMRRYAARARRLGVRFRLGETAIRWTGDRLLVVGPGTSESIPAAHLFFAGGLRPATAAALGLAGDRPAGLLPATVAEHLLLAGERLWRRVAVLGSGPWAATVADRARRLGTEVVTVGTRPLSWSVAGRDRVTALHLTHAGGRAETIDCDAVVLADQPVANRNVDGAVLPGSAGVTFVQPVTPIGGPARYDNAHQVATAWLAGRRKVNDR